MANQEQVKILRRRGVTFWNEWHKNFISYSLHDDGDDEIDLTEANFSGLDLSGVNLAGANLAGANFSDTNLTDSELGSADLSEVDLSGANLKNADLSQANLSRANLYMAFLQDTFLHGADLSYACLGDADMSTANLTHANLDNSDLDSANLSEAKLINSRLQEANLSNANLSRAFALNTDFTKAKLTGACLESWNINAATKLDNIECQYVYLVYPNQERRPSDPSRIFQPGEFTKLFQKALSTVDLIFRNGVDWQALLISLEKLRVEANGTELSIQAIENKNDGAFVVRVNVPPDANKPAVEQFLRREYELALGILDEQYRSELKAKDIEIDGYRRENANLMKLAEWASNRPIIVQATATAENQVMSSDRHINTGGGNYIESNPGTYIQGNYLNISQDLGQAAAQIQDLLDQLKQQGMTDEQAQQYVANDIKTQAQKDPSLHQKMVKWGQSLGDSAVKTVVTESVKIVLRLAGVLL